MVRADGDVTQPDIVTPQLDLFGGAPVRAPVINPDGSVKGSTVIYVPEGEAFEFAALATNANRGCGHSCKYCSVPRTTHQDRTEFNAGAILRPNYLERLRKDAALYQRAGVREQVLMSFITDPYHPGDTTPTRTAIEILIEHGLAVSILSKGGTRALRDIDLFRPDRDCYAATLTSLDHRLSRKGSATPRCRATASPRSRSFPAGGFTPGCRSSRCSTWRPRCPSSRRRPPSSTTTRSAR
jgi:hypothetical protein